MTAYPWNKIKLLFFIFFQFFLTSMLSAGDMAVVPYKTENFNPEEMLSVSEDYAKNMAMAALILKGADVYDPYQLKQDMKSLGINPNKKISLDDLSILSKKRYINYIISGKVIKNKKGFRAKSFVYSSANGRILYSSDVSAKTLLKTAESDIDQLLSFFIDDKIPGKKNYFNINIVYDSSYNMFKEIKPLKISLKKLAARVYNGWPGSNFSFIKYSDEIKNFNNIRSESLFKVEREIDKINLKGKNSGKTLYDGVLYALNNIPYGKKAEDIILIVTNSQYYNKNFIHSLAYKAKERNIKIYTLLLGNVTGKSEAQYKEISLITNGAVFRTTYRQRFVDSMGEAFYLFVENERIFKSEINNSEWQAGILKYEPGTNNTRYQVDDSVTELFYTKNHYSITPENLKIIYDRFGKRKIIKTGELEVNLNGVFNSFYKKITNNNRNNMRSKPIARVLLKDDKNSIWIDVVNQSDLSFFKTKKELGHMFYLGVEVLLNKDEVYGLSFNPGKYIIGLDSSYIAKNMILKIEDIITNTPDIINSGIGEPSNWFIKVKVENINEYLAAPDLRE